MDQKSILTARELLMQNRRVICTGNPNRDGTLAQGFKKIFPDAIFLCRSTGWDLSDHSVVNRNKVREIFRGSNTFLNCSYIFPGTQSWLLDICHESVKFCDVVNIGSTHEYDGLGKEEYKKSKLELRKKSLAYNTFRFSTCHFIIGSIKKGDSNPSWLNVDDICKTIVWTWQNSYRVPLMAIDQQKEPW